MVDKDTLAATGKYTHIHTHTNATLKIQLLTNPADLCFRLSYYYAIFRKYTFKKHIAHNIKNEMLKAYRWQFVQALKGG